MWEMEMSVSPLPSRPPPHPGGEAGGTEPTPLLVSVDVVVLVLAAVVPVLVLLVLVAALVPPSSGPVQLVERARPGPEPSRGPPPPAPAARLVRRWRLFPRQFRRVRRWPPPPVSSPVRLDLERPHGPGGEGVRGDGAKVLQWDAHLDKEKKTINLVGIFQTILQREMSVLKVSNWSCEQRQA